LQSQYTPDAAGQQLNQLQTLLLGTRGGNNAPWNPTQPQEGLLSTYTGTVAPQLETSQEALSSSQRGADIADLSRLGPQGLSAIKASNPAAAQLLDRLTGTATSELGMGAALDPSLMRLVRQGVLSRNTGTLTGTGNAGDYGMALGLSQFGNQLRQQRVGNASNALGLSQSMYSQPLQGYLGSRSAGFGPAAGVIGGATGMQGTSALNFLNPESPYAQDLYDTNFNAQVTRSIGNANNNNALIGAGIKALGSVLGGIAGGI
jgi:hypothetical protein